MRVLVIGSGAREHALVWKLVHSPHVSAVFAAPGNAGIARLAPSAPIAATDVEGLQRHALDHYVDLTVVGPEAPLAAGIVDAFQAAGLAIFGPTQAAARIESSKVWAKELMEREQVPTARWASAESPAQARALAREFGLPVVLKADGLAEGKGVVVCRSQDEVDATIERLMVERRWGAAGDRLVVEECLQGPELSVFALADGEHVLPLIAARDYKPLLDGNRGPNTGGMGGYTRPADATPALMEEVRARIVEPTIAGLARAGCPYVGVLYAQLMLTRDGPKVIEFNARWGDPEAQLALPLLESDLLELMLACLDGRLDTAAAEWRPGATLGVTLASAGYPQSSHKGDVIQGWDAVDDDVLVFHAATRWGIAPEPQGQPPLLTDGGRVLTVVALGRTVAEARQKAYANVARIHFDGMQYRRDLGADEPPAPPPTPIPTASRGETTA